MDELRKQLEQKYNLNLNILDGRESEKTYWDFREYFIKELESEEIIMVNTDYVRICCHKSDVAAIREEFETKLKEIIPNHDELEDCNDLYRVGCRQSNYESDNLEEENENPPPPYKN